MLPQAWLNPVQLPSPNQLKCKVTGKQMNFLLQIYVPVDEDYDHAFHRSLFLFISPEGDKLAQPGAVVALRCQLPRSNPYYPFNAPKREQKAPPPLPVRSTLIKEEKPWGNPRMVLISACRHQRRVCAHANADYCLPFVPTCLTCCPLLLAAGRPAA